jgi:hypothetical protein
MRRFPELGQKDFRVFKKLWTPAKVQNFLDKIPANFETKGKTCRSPLEVLKHNEAHCMEGAMLAAAVFWYNGEQPLLLDLRTTMKDDDHVVTLFKYKNRWGATSKTNHAVLRYRDPIFKTVRELALSYFNEYFLDSGEKTLREFSAPFSLLRYNNEWLTSQKSLRYIANDLDLSQHFKLFPSATARNLRPADTVEIKAGKLTQWKKR